MYILIGIFTHISKSPSLFSFYN